MNRIVIKSVGPFLSLLTICWSAVAGEIIGKVTGDKNWDARSDLPSQFGGYEFVTSEAGRMGDRFPGRATAKPVVGEAWATHGNLLAKRAA